MAALGAAAATAPRAAFVRSAASGPSHASRTKGQPPVASSTNLVAAGLAPRQLCKRPSQPCNTPGHSASPPCTLGDSARSPTAAMPRSVNAVCSSRRSRARENSAVCTNTAAQRLTSSTRAQASTPNRRSPGAPGGAKSGERSGLRALSSAREPPHELAQRMPLRIRSGPARREACEFCLLTAGSPWPQSCASRLTAWCLEKTSQRHRKLPSSASASGPRPTASRNASRSLLCR
mmetsp:Transcript_75975/g.240318  ORF Transcript_75975/g.240318 Transcript_75975/m.240318 type:complete len:234 (+) Transcript_75975:194-895(+)